MMAPTHQDCSADSNGHNQQRAPDDCADARTITVGNRQDQPQGRRFTVAVRQSLVRSLSDTLKRIWKGVDPWFSLSLFQGDYRSGERFLSARFRGIDIDYYNERGEHAEVPLAVASALADLAVAGRLGGHVYYATPRGARLIDGYTRAITSHAEFKTVAAARAAEIEAVLRESGLAAERKEIDGRLKWAGGSLVDRGASSDLARFFWPPNATVAGRQRRAEVHVIADELYDLSTILASGSGREARQSETAGRLPSQRSGLEGGSSRYASNALVSACSMIANATDERHNTLRDQVIGIAGLAAGGYLDSAVARQELMAAAYQCQAATAGDDPFLTSDIERTMRDAWAYGFARARQVEPTDSRPGETRERVSANSANRSAESEDKWEQPAQLGTAALPIFPLAAMPRCIGRYILGLATAAQVSVDAPAMLALAVLASVCGGRVRIAMPRHEEPTTLWIVVVLSSANRKSSIFRAILRPVTDYELARASDLGPEIRQARTERGVLERRVHHLETRAAKECDSAKRQTLMAQAVEAAEVLAQLQIPVAPQLVCDDCTPERLVGLLLAQGGRMSIMSAEGGVFGLMAGRYSSSGPNLDVFLKGHAGDAIRVDRVHREPEHIVDPALSMGLMVQPSVLAGLADVPEFRGRGLLARFLFAIPQSLLGARDPEPPPIPSEAEVAYRTAIEQLVARCEAGSIKLTLTNDAKAVWLGVVREIEPRLGEDGDLAPMNDWAGKLCGAVGRIAALLHVLAEEPEKPVSAETMANAATIGRYLIAHAQAAYGLMGADPAVAAARHLWRWIERSQNTAVTERQIFEGVKGRFRTMNELRPLVRLLEQHGYLRERSRAAGGRGRPPSPTFDVNPLARSGSHNSHNSDVGDQEQPAPVEEPGCDATKAASREESAVEEFIV